MTMTTRVLFTSLLLAGTMAVSVPAQAEGYGKLSANISMLNDYRFRGVSQNDKSFTLQGGLDWSGDSGFYVGTWASNISDFRGASEETDVYGGYSGEKNGITYDVGGLLYHYPGGKNTDYVELYGSTGIDLGFISATVGANYAFSNNNLGNRDNIYIYTDADTVIPNSPVTIILHLGYENGALAAKKLDWKVGASVSYQGLDFGVSYIDTNIGGNSSGAGIVFSVGASF